MFRQTTDKMIGKTIKKIRHTLNDGLFIIFTDESFICLYPVKGYNNDLFISFKGKIDIDNCSDISEIVDAGIITMPEYNEMMEAKKAEKIMMEENIDRREWKRLKAKYEPGS